MGMSGTSTLPPGDSYNAAETGDDPIKDTPLGSPKDNDTDTSADMGSDSAGENSMSSGGDTGQPSPGSDPGQNTTPGEKAKLDLPAIPNGATENVRAFVESATRSVQRIYLENYTDPAVVSSLGEKLNSDVTLASVKAIWSPLLDKAAEHARTIEPLGLALRQLTQAFAEAQFDEELSIYRHVNMVECRLAFRQVRDLDPEAMALEVTIAPLGRQSLEALEIACKDSHVTELIDRDFPAIVGPKRVRKKAKRAFRAEMGRGKILKVSVRKPWTKDTEDKQIRYLEVVFGVKRRKAFPEDPCVMQNVRLTQRRRGRGKRWGPVECCDIQETLPIACSILEQ